jgi:hypothetical protein
LGMDIEVIYLITELEFAIGSAIKW